MGAPGHTIAAETCLRRLHDAVGAVFGSVAEADESEFKEQERLKKQWGGLLHPETTAA